MYPSDYGYATSGGSTSDRSSCLWKPLNDWHDTSYDDCKNNDWLYNSSRMQHTISPIGFSPVSDFPSADGIFVVTVSGRVDGGGAANDGLIRPSVYLLSTTKILSGEGTPENPYTIG